MRTIHACLLTVLLAAGACTEPNPGYSLGGDSDVKPRDAATTDGVDRRPDAAPTPDLQQLPDQMRPDLLPDPCDGVGDCRDGLGCTDDQCVDGRCANPVREGFCVIGGVCYANETGDAAYPCLICDPEQTQRDWSQREDGSGCDSDDLDCTNDICRAGRCVHERDEKSCLIDGICLEDGKPDADGCRLCDADSNSWVNAKDDSSCADDNLDCTNDVCLGGQCTHAVTGGCLIGGVCQAPGYALPGDECRLCVPDADTETLTFVDGKLCDSEAGLCAFDACRHVVEKESEWIPRLSGSARVASARCNSVDAIVDQGGIWAVGGYTDQNARQGGFLLRLDGNGTQILAPRPLADISHRAAVGRGGLVVLHGASGWSRASLIEQHLGTTARGAVGGYRVGTRDVLYIAGTHAPPTSPGIVRCVLDGLSVDCQDQVGLTTGTVFSPLTIGSGNATRVWAVGDLLAGPTIYSALESNSSFSDAPPEGCDGSALCGFHLGGELRALHGSSDSDVWAVGDDGIVLRYDGVRWSEVKGLPADIADYTLTAAYSSTTTPLVLLVGFSNSLAGRRIAVFGYHRDLQRGAGPLVVDTLSGLTIGDPGMLVHVGGSEPDQLWLVGYRSSSFVSTSTAGWILRLE